MCLVPNLVAHPRDDGLPLRRVVPRTRHSTRQLAARPWLRRPSPIPPLISRGAEQALASRTNAFRLNPSSWTDRPSTGLGPPGPVKTEKAIKPANAIAYAFVPPLMARGRRRPTVGGGVTTRVKYQILPMVRAGQRSRRGAAERSSGAAEQTLELRASLSPTSAAAEQTSQ